jgi:hypothetical protein
MRQEVVAAALPALLFAAYAVFRRLYMLALATAIYAPAAKRAAADDARTQGWWNRRFVTRIRRRG